MVSNLAHHHLRISSLLWIIDQTSLEFIYCNKKKKEKKTPCSGISNLRLFTETRGSTFHNLWSATCSMLIEHDARRQREVDPSMTRLKNQHNAPQHLCVPRNNEDDSISLFSMLIFANLFFITNLKKESDTIRNCSSNSPFPRGSTENRSLHFSSERFIIHLQGVQIRYKIGKIIKYRQERKHYIYTSSELLIISIYS